MKLFYSNRGVMIYHGDVREIRQASLPRFDLVVADPPYGETNLHWDHWPDGWPAHIASHIRPSGSLWCFGSLKMFLKHWADFSEFTHSQEVIWEKHNGSNSSADRFRRVHELVLHFYQGAWSKVYKAPVYTQDAEKRRTKRQTKPAHWNGIGNSVYETEQDGNRWLRSVIYARSCHGRALNPTQKPTEIICPLIEHSCPPGGLVLDAFMGSGAVLEAAMIMGRCAIGVDKRISECEIAAERMEKLQARGNVQTFGMMS